jgi:hypothetical protein
MVRGVTASRHQALFSLEIVPLLLLLLLLLLHNAAASA